MDPDWRDEPPPTEPDHGTLPEDDLPPPHDLGWASTGHLRTLSRGLLLAQASLVGYVVIVIVSAVAGFMAGPGPGGPGGPGGPPGPTPGGAPVVSPPSSVLAALVVLGLLTQLAGLVGWWLLSSEDEHPESPGAGAEGLRRVVRAVLVLSVGIIVVGAFAPPAVAPALMGVNLILLLAGFLTRMLLTIHIAERAANARVVARARLLMWLGPLLCSVGMMCLAIGPLISIALYASMLGWLRSDVRAIIGDREREGLDLL